MVVVDPIARKLLHIWRLNGSNGDYVFLAVKQGKSWQDFSFQLSDTILADLTEWFKKHPAETFDIYWSPLVFKAPRRRSENVKSTRLLWSDLDNVDLKKLDKQGLLPTYHWESSPGRYQGLWLLDQLLPAEEAQLLNRNLSYTIGADKSGWDLTQVLRVPGTINHKYPDEPPVKEMVDTHQTYKVEDLRTSIGEPQVEEKNVIELDTSIPEINQAEIVKILEKYHNRIPRKVLTLLFSTSATIGKRSDILWYIEHELYNAGVAPNEILLLVKNSVWNKYQGRKDEDTRLLTEMKKILEKKLQKSDDKEGTIQETVQEIPQYQYKLVIEDYNEVLGKITSQPGWLVEGFWTKRSHGIVAGEPKSLKSILTMDLALSIVSGKPFLGQFPIHETGPVLIIQNENADWIVKDRLEKMIVNKDLAGKVNKIQDTLFAIQFPITLPLYFINQQGYQLNDPIHRKLLEQVIQQIKPVLIIFDPLYLMFDGDVNSAKDLNPVLNWLLYLKTKYKTGIIVVHHWNKGGTSKRGGQRMLGSTTLHGWVESAWYLKVTSKNPEGTEETEDDINPGETPPINLVLEREFRSAGMYPKLDLTVSMGGFQEHEYKVDVKQHTKKTKEPNQINTESDQDKIINLLSLNKKPVSLRIISEQTGLSRRKVSLAIAELLENGEIKEAKNGYEIIE